MNTSNHTAASYQRRFKTSYQEGGISASAIWAGAYFCLPMFMVGGLLQNGLPLGAVVVCGLAGFGIVGLYSCVVGMQSNDTGLTIHSAAAAAMGSVAAQIITSMPIALTSIGWYAIQAVTLGSGFSAVFRSFTGVALSPAVSTLIWGSVTGLIAMGGYRWMKYFAYVSLPLCAGILIYALVSIFSDGVSGGGGIWSYRPIQNIPMLSGISTVVAACALSGVMIGDIFRHCKTRAHTAAACVCTVAIQTTVLCIGAALVIATGQWDLTALLTGRGHPVLALVYLIFSSIAVNLTNAYSGGVAVSMMLGINEDRFKLTCGIACSIGVVLGAMGIMSLFAAFLSLVSSLIPPLAGVVIGSYWILGRGSKEEFFKTPDRDLYLPGLIAFALGAFTAYLTSAILPFFIPALNGLAVSLFSYCLLSKWMDDADASKNLSLSSKFTGGFVFCAVITIATGGLGLSAIQALTTAENAALSADLTAMTVMLMLIGVVLSFGLGIMFTGLVVKPIRHMFSLLKTIATGDLTGSIESERNDEIGEMTRLLERTQVGISALILAVRTKEQGLEQVGKELTVMTEQEASTVEQVSANAQDMKEKALAQAEKAYEVMEAMVANIQALDAHIEEQAQSVLRSSSSIEEMLSNIGSITADLVANQRNMSELSLAAEKGSTGVEEVAGAIGRIVSESERLLEINRVIQRIVTETNLLSMNAAIEAAHAGNAGVGFAVVASEIRQLAESSSVQVKTVSSVLKEVKGSLEGIGGSAQNVLRYFEDIDKAVKTVSTLEDHIRRSMEEQHAGSQDIIKAISQSQEITRSVRSGSQAVVSGSKRDIERSKEALTADLSGGMNEIAAGISQIKSAINRTKDISAENRRNIEALAHELSKFRTG
ncbi:MAG: methyl-accepting chemotaxis protein, partial [Treponema sp.]|nr:methyl-accepting chemotaxis protein [Treponema sp.]